MSGFIVYFDKYGGVPYHLKTFSFDQAKEFALEIVLSR